MNTIAPLLHRPTATSRWTSSALPYVTFAWALGYGTLRSFWAYGDRPSLPPIGDDLTVFSDWGVVALAVAAGLLAPLLASGRGSRPVRWVLAVAGGLVGLTLIGAACLIVLDLVALVFPGIGIPSSAAALASRAGCLAGGLLMVATARTAVRQLREACSRCGRTHAVDRPDPRAGAVPAPRWVVVAGYLAVAGCLVREIAQAAIGFGPEGNPYARQNLGAGIAFLIALTLAGTLLPLALVHNWGQVWPRWTLWLAGHRVPRWLVLGPAFLVSGSLVAYFGTGFIQLLAAPAPVNESSGPGSTFLVVAVSAYLLWGIALGVATLSYFSRTRPICRHCGG